MKLSQIKPFCPQPVRCTGELDSNVQLGGNLPPPLVSSQSTTRGNLFYYKQKNHSIKYLDSVSSVTAVIELYGGKYIYHLSFDAYHRIRRIDDDCQRCHGHPISVKYHLYLCKRYCYNLHNEHLSIL